MKLRVGVCVCVCVVSCNEPSHSDPFGSGSSSGAGSSGTTTSTSAVDTTGVDGSTSNGSGPKLDIYQPDTPFDPPDPTCRVVDGMDAVGDCTDEAPADSFDPDVQWTWDGGAAAVTPLVINLTDDNADGAIDLCDTPDIVVVVGAGLGAAIVVLDGATGTEHFTIAAPVNPFVTPAVGDIDNDGLPEIVAGAGPIFGSLSFIAFEHDGALKWQTDPIWAHDQGGAVALADIDNDGEPEAIADGNVVGGDGVVELILPAQTGWFIAQRNTATAAADLDGDGDLEIVLGQAAYHHDGVEIWNDPAVLPGYPEIANLDADDDPEVIVNNDNGITVLEHDGSVKYLDMRPTGDMGLGAWFRPSTVHDFDGDQVSEFAVSSAAHYSVFEPNLTIKWTAPVQDGSGWAAGTAFDFLGDGGAEAMYADEATLFVFDDAGMPLLSVPRSSKTLIEYPVVADVDNDGSAEIVVVSSEDWDDVQTAPTVQVIRDAEDRWIQARRIWNQHTYHVTNVREDGTIPQFEPPSWQLLNTYRTNAQIEDGSVCDPRPEG